MISDRNNSRIDLLFDNRLRLRHTAFAAFAAAAVIAGIDVLSPSNPAAEVFRFLVPGLIVVAACISILYAQIFRLKPVEVPVDSAIQMIILLLYVSAGTLHSIGRISVDHSLYGFLAVAILLLLHIRKTPAFSGILYGSAVLALFYSAYYSVSGLSADLVSVIVLQTGLAAYVAYLREKDALEKHDLQVQLSEQSIVDPLTDVYNRGFFIEELERTLQRMKRYGNDFCIAILDIDEFRTINKSYGTVVGDSVLETYAWNLLDHLRESDVVARNGADEFYILLAETGKEEAEPVMERIRQSFAALTMEGIEEPLTCSIGLVEARKDATTNDLLKAGEGSLAAAREAGGNCIR